MFCLGVVKVVVGQQRIIVVIIMAEVLLDTALRYVVMVICSGRILLRHKSCGIFRLLLQVLAGVQRRTTAAAVVAAAS